MDAEVTRILLLSANPKDTDQLRLNEEFREIREGLSLSDNRSLFEIKQGGATRAKDLRRLIISYNPHIVHFSGHSSTDGIFLESDTGRYNPVTGYALANLFSLFADTVRCVILNACYSRDQAIEIVQQIPYVVGMSTRIRDDSAIQFAIGFYDAIGAGRNIEDAYKFGCNAIQLEGGNNLGGSNRSLILPIADSGDLDKYTDIDEADKPVLLTRVRAVKKDSEVKVKPSSASIEPEVQKVKSTIALDETVDPAPVPVQKTPNKWLPWILASLVLLPVLSFVLWDYSKRGVFDDPGTSSETVTIEENTAVKVGAPVVDPEIPDKAQEKVAEEIVETVQGVGENEEAKSIRQVEQQRLREEARATEIEQERILRERELALEKEQEEKRKEQQRQAQQRAEANKRARLEKLKSEQAAAASRQRAEQIRKQQLKQQEEQRRAAAAREAWQVKQAEIARQQAEQQRRDQLQQQKAAEAAKQQQTPAPKPEQKKESAADRMVREVEELWFDR